MRGQGFLSLRLKVTIYTAHIVVVVHLDILEKFSTSVINLSHVLCVIIVAAAYETNRV